MRGAVELTNVHDVGLVLENGSLVRVNVKVVGSGEDGHDRGEASSLGLLVHAVTCVLSLVRTDNREKIVTLEELAGSVVGEEVATATDVVVDKVLRWVLLVAKVL